MLQTIAGRKKTPPESAGSELKANRVVQPCESTSAPPSDDCTTTGDHKREAPKISLPPPNSSPRTERGRHLAAGEAQPHPLQTPSLNSRNPRLPASSFNSIELLRSAYESVCQDEERLLKKYERVQQMYRKASAACKSLHKGNQELSKIIESYRQKQKDKLIQREEKMKLSSSILSAVGSKAPSQLPGLAEFKDASEEHREILPRQELITGQARATRSKPNNFMRRDEISSCDKGTKYVTAASVKTTRSKQRKPLKKAKVSGKRKTTRSSGKKPSPDCAVPSDEWGWPPGSMRSIIADGAARYEVADCHPEYVGPIDDSSVGWEPCLILGERNTRFCDVQIASDGQKCLHVPRRFVRDRQNPPSEHDVALRLKAKRESLSPANDSTNGGGGATCASPNLERASQDLLSPSYLHSYSSGVQDMEDQHSDDRRNSPHAPPGAASLPTKQSSNVANLEVKTQIDYTKQQIDSPSNISDTGSQLSESLFVANERRDAWVRYHHEDFIEVRPTKKRKQYRNVVMPPASITVGANNHTSVRGEDDDFEPSRRRKRKRKLQNIESRSEKRRRHREHKEMKRARRASRQEKKKRKKKKRKHERKKAKLRKATRQHRSTKNSSSISSSSEELESDSFSDSLINQNDEIEGHVDYVNNRFVGTSASASSSKLSRDAASSHLEGDIAAVNMENAVHDRSSVFRRNRKQMNMANAQTPGGYLQNMTGRQDERRKRMQQMTRSGMEGDRDHNSSGSSDSFVVSEESEQSEYSSDSEMPDHGRNARRYSKKQVSENPGYKYEEVVRGNARKALPGHNCPQCQEFWNAVGKDADVLAKSGIKIGDLCKEHSRHRSRFKAPETPESYWNLSMQSVQEGSPGMNINQSIM